VVIVALVVMGPKECRRGSESGQWAASPRMAAIARAERHRRRPNTSATEGLTTTSARSRKLRAVSSMASRKAGLGLAAAHRFVGVIVYSSPARARSRLPQRSRCGVFSDQFVERDRRTRAKARNSYGALSDTAIVYDNTLEGALADDPPYMLGDASAKMPGTEEGKTTRPNDRRSDPARSPRVDAQDEDLGAFERAPNRV